MITWHKWSECTVLHSVLKEYITLIYLSFQKQTFFSNIKESKAWVSNKNGSVWAARMSDIRLAQINSTHKNGFTVRKERSQNLK